jgi:flagellar biosynthesis component FlhA
VLKGLISEGISIRPLPLILETLSDHASDINNRWDLTEKVRAQLSRHIVSKLTQESGDSIQVFTISTEIEKQIATAWHRENDEIRINLPREIIENLAGAIQNAAHKMRESGMKPIALVDQSIRPVIAELAFDNASNMFVLGRQEALGADVEIVGEISADELHTVAQAA